MLRIEAIYAACERMPQAAFFAAPVDPVELEPDYFDIIKRPMDMGTIKKHLDSGKYSTHEVFAEHMRLTFHNAYTYNHMEDNPVRGRTEMERLFDSLYERCGRSEGPLSMEGGGAGGLAGVQQSVVGLRP